MKVVAEQRMTVALPDEICGAQMNSTGFGSPFSPDSINNPFGAGNPYSPMNPYGRGLRIEGR